MRKLVSFLLLVTLAACSPAAATPSQPITLPTNVPTQTPVPASPTPTPPPTDTPTPPPTATPQPTPTATPLSDELRTEVINAYKIMLLIQIDANLINETAARVNSGELTGFDSLGALIAVAALVSVVDKAIPETEVPSLLQPFWDQVLPVHDQCKDIVARWFNKEITSTDVLAEMEPLLAAIDTILDETDQTLATEYGFDPQELQDQRDEAIQQINAALNTPTPAP